MASEYDRRRRRLNRRGDEAMDDARYAVDSFREALQPRGCAVAIVASVAAWAVVIAVIVRQV